MERRNNDSDGPAQGPSNPNVFDDDFEVDPDEDDFMPSVSDGFRPLNANANANANEAARPGRPHPDRTEPPPRPLSTSKPNDQGLRRVATRNSTAKVRDSMTHDRRPPFSHAPHASHANRDSISSLGSFAATSNSENPFETGPSHPYGMYRQNITARPISVATTSTDRMPHRSISLQRPTHPYAMYSQSGLADEEPLEEPEPAPALPVQRAIPVGFLGQDTGYHRVLGPDGEEQDIIGPNGHTEQLPPYSRYPDEGPTKASLAAEASASRVVPAPAPLDLDDPFTTPASPVSPLSPTGFSTPSLSTTPLLPSVTPARLPQQRPETQTGTLAFTTSDQVHTVPAEPSDSSSASLLSTENSFSEKAEPAEAKAMWHKRKLWRRISVGFALIAFSLIILLAVTIGAAIGTLLTKKHHDDKWRDGQLQPQPQITPGEGQIFGAMPIPTPPGLAPLPTGTFALPLGLPQENKPGCLTQANQFAAWSCRMTFAPLVITINDTTASESSHQLASIKSGPLPDGTIMYGLQTPQVDFQQLQLVLDMDYKAFGPAYHFSFLYDKLVVLREEELSTGPSKVKRDDDDPSHQRFQVKPGDNPWYCYWNHTYVEGYIYAQDNSTDALSPDAPYPSFFGSVAGSAPTSAVAVSTGGTQTSPTQPAQASSTPSRPARARRDAPPDPSGSSRLQSYPRIVKLEERRLANSPPAYCQKMYLLDNGKITPATNGNEAPLRVWLQEQDPSYSEYIALASQSQLQPTPTSHSTRKRKRDIAPKNEKRADPGDACHCQWMYQ